MSNYAIDIQTEEKTFYVKSKTEFTKNGKPKSFPVTFRKVILTVKHRKTERSFVLETSNRLKGWKDSRDNGRLTDRDMGREARRLLTAEQINKVSSAAGMPIAV